MRIAGWYLIGASVAALLNSARSPSREGAHRRSSRILREFGCSVPEDRLLQMSLDGLLSLAARRKDGPDH
jgi:hypothetical protein